MGILPLGTGNDLARVLGWGKGYEDEDIEEILTAVEHAELSMLDRWRVSMEHKRYLGLRKGTREITMNNYLGIGCGAGVALNFHRQRESRPELFQSRIINKVRESVAMTCACLMDKAQGVTPIHSVQGSRLFSGLDCMLELAVITP